MSDQPKKQELPPLDVTEKDSIAGQRAHRHSKYGFMGMIGCRERQLLAALSDNEALRADNEAKDARIAELQRTVNAVAGGAAQGLMLHAKLNNAFSAGEQRVRQSVEGLLERPVVSFERAGSIQRICYKAEVDALLARLREAVK